MTKIKFITISIMALFLTMCVPPEGGSGSDLAKDRARLDSLRELRCPRLMSSAAEYYRNREWKQTIRVYS